MVDLTIKTRLPSKKMLERIPADVWTAAKPWLDETGVELARQIRYRIAVQHKGAEPGGKESFLPRLSPRYARAAGIDASAPDYHRTGQLIASIQPRVMVTKKGEAKLIVRPYGRRDAAQEKERLTRRQGRALPVYTTTWEGGYESFAAEMEDYGFLAGDRQEAKGGFEVALPKIRYWVNAHSRKGSGIVQGGKEPEHDVRWTKPRTSPRTSRTQSEHYREGHNISGYWRALPDTIRLKRGGYWSVAIQAWVVGENRRRGAASPKAAQNAAVADSLSRRLGGGRWAPPGRRASPFISFSQPQIQNALYRWNIGMHGKIRAIVDNATKPTGP